MSFHVPELARVTGGQMGTDASYGNNGAFDLESPESGWRLALICSDTSEAIAEGWEHVSVHAYRGTKGPSSKLRTPTWKEMAYIKRLCWDEEDVVVQFHPRKSEYVNVHPHVLHLWRSSTQLFPTPPPILVGPLQSETV